MRELFGDIRGRLHTPVVWNAVTRQNDPISTAFAFCHFLNIARSRHRSRNLPFVGHDRDGAKGKGQDFHPVSP
jgi:hypothetical protein